jgi:hypothetical protein
MKITLNLKKEFENDKKRSKSDPPKEKADESNILSYTVSGTLYGVSSIPAMQAIEVWSPTVQIRQLLRENKLSRR